MRGKKISILSLKGSNGPLCISGFQFSAETYLVLLTFVYVRHQIAS